MRDDDPPTWLVAAFVIGMMFLIPLGAYISNPDVKFGSIEIESQ
jgi:hypothetical protein